MKTNLYLLLMENDLGDEPSASLFLDRNEALAYAMGKDDPDFGIRYTNGTLTEYVLEDGVLTYTEMEFLPEPYEESEPIQFEVFQIDMAYLEAESLRPFSEETTLNLLRDPKISLGANYPFVLVATVAANTCDDAFMLTNHFVGSWYDNPNVTVHSKSRSTSVGDVVINKSDDSIWIVAVNGFTELATGQTNMHV